ncbi:MAG: aminotransferase class V-fold PLP-dependent enzyme [Sphingomonadales bacterium]
MTIACQRHLFEIPDDIAYLNCGFMSPLLKGVRFAGTQGLARKSRPWEITPRDFFTESETARGLFAQLVGARTDDIAIIPAVSYGLAIAAANIPVQARQSIIVLDGQFPSNVHCWNEIARENQARVVTVRRADGRDWTTAIMEALDATTAAVAVPHCHWIDGTVIDLEAIGARCRELGAALLVDVTQSLGVMPFDVARIRPDFVVAATYKWLLGPYSLGFAYIAPQWQSGVPLEHNWIARRDSEDFNNLIRYRKDFQPGARRFDVGERSNFALMPAAISGMKQLIDWGIGEISETLRAMTHNIAERAGALGLQAAPAQFRSPHYLSVKWPASRAEALMSRLAEHKVHISQRGGSLRITPHLYNNEADIDRLLAAFKEALV